MTPSIVVVKVGGSLLDWPGLADALGADLAARRADRVVLVVGGGRFADALRALDAAQFLGEARSHALALRVLGLTAAVLADLVPGLEAVDDVAKLVPTWSSGKIPVLAPRRFLLDDDRRPDPLPHAWTTTTDAIAARLAVRLGAAELALLKSAPAPPGLDLAGSARLGLVDPETPRAAKGLPRVTYRNLRDPGLGGDAVVLVPGPRDTR